MKSENTSTMLVELVSERIKSENISIREASRQIGMAHVTLIRLLEGGTVDLVTVDLVAKWLEVPTAVALGLRDDKCELVDTIVALIQTSPRLAKIFASSKDSLLKGDITPEEMRDIIDYAAFKVFKRGK